MPLESLDTMYWKSSTFKVSVTLVGFYAVDLMIQGEITGNIQTHIHNTIPKIYCDSNIVSFQLLWYFVILSLLTIINFTCTSHIHQLNNNPQPLPIPATPPSVNLGTVQGDIWLQQPAGFGFLKATIHMFSVTMCAWNLWTWTLGECTERVLMAIQSTLL